VTALLTVTQAFSFPHWDLAADSGFRWFAAIIAKEPRS
jgi:hypothetical protein